MMEFDVRSTSDDQLVLMHDDRVDRTTNGSGFVSQLTLTELKQLDAGSWKHRRFREARIPTLDEVLQVLPINVWLNIHIKGGTRTAQRAAQTVAAHNRLRQSFLACGADDARVARISEPRILICNMDRQQNSREYVTATIGQQADFIQFLGRRAVALDLVPRLKQNGVRVNYCCCDDKLAVRELYAAGIEFILVDDVRTMVRAAQQQGIAPLIPVFAHKP